MKRKVIKQQEQATTHNYKIRLTFQEPLLGTAPKNQNLYASYVASKKADLTSEELADEVLQR